MDRLSVYIHLDPNKLHELGEPVKTMRKLKLAGDETGFLFTEARVMTCFCEDINEKWTEMDAFRIFLLRLKQYKVMDKLKEFLIRYPDGTIEDVLEAHKKNQAKLREKGWLDEEGNVIPIGPNGPLTKEELEKIAKVK